MSLSDDPLVDRQAEELGLPDGGVELGWGEERAEVGERPARIGHRYSVAARALRPLRGPLRIRRAQVAEDGVFAAGEHRGRPSSVLAEPRVPDG